MYNKSYIKWFMKERRCSLRNWTIKKESTDSNYENLVITFLVCKMVPLTVMRTGAKILFELC